MAKKSSKKSLVFLIAVLCGIVALAMFFLPVLKYHVDGLLDGSYDETTYTGFNMIFDLENCNNVAYSALGIKVENTVSTKLVPIVLISGILTVVGIIAALLTQAVNKKSKMLVKVVAFVFFIAAAVLIIAVSKASFVAANETPDSIAKNINPAIGAYLICAFNSCAGLLSLAA